MFHSSVKGGADRGVSWPEGIGERFIDPKASLVSSSLWMAVC